MPNQSSAFNGPPPFGNMSLGPKPSDHPAPTQLPAQGMQMNNFNAANSPNFAQRQFQRNQTPPSMLNMSNANARFPAQQCGPNNNMMPHYYRPAMQQNVSWRLRFGLRALLQVILLFQGQQQMGFPQNMHQPQPQQQPQSNVPAAKWHIPQSAQQTNGNGAMQSGQSSLAMQFGTNPALKYKIALKSPSSMKPSGQQNGAATITNSNDSAANTSTTATSNAPSAPVEIPSTVTSTNPKTPSPNTNDVRSTSRDFENGI